MGNKSVGDQSQSRLDKTGNFNAVRSAQKSADFERGISREDALRFAPHQVLEEEKRISDNISAITSPQDGTLIGNTAVDGEYWNNLLDLPN